MAGWVKLHRKLFESDLWHDVTTCRLFLLLVGMASHQDGVVISGIELKRGQYLRSYRKLAEDLSYREGRGKKKNSLSTIKKSVDKLVKNSMVSILETEQGTLFTVLNYAKYQDSEGYEQGTANGTENQLRTNYELTANNNKNARMQECKELKTSSGSSEPENVFVFYEKNMGFLSPFISENISQWIDDVGEELVLASMKIAAKGRKDFRYAEGVLRRWQQNGIQTIEQARSFELEHQNNKHESKKRTYKPKPNPKQDKLPKWMDKEQGAPPEEEPVTDEEKAALQKMIEELSQGD